MSPKDQSNPNQTSQGRSGISPGLGIKLIAGMIVASTLVSSVVAVLTVLGLQQMGLIVTTNPSSSSSPVNTGVPTPISSSPTPSPSPTSTSSPSPTNISSASPSPSSSSPSPSPSQTPSIKSSTSNTSANSSSIFSLECIQSDPDSKGAFVKNGEPRSITINQEIVPEIGYFHNADSNGHYLYRYAAQTCNLNGKFQRLKLVLGIDSSHPNARPNRSIKVGTRLDGKLGDTVNVALNAKQSIDIKLQNVRSLGISVECSGDSYCPRLSILEASLQ
jgi:hypothetical protein